MSGMILSSDPSYAMTKGTVLVAFKAIPDIRQRYTNYHFFKKKDQLLPLGILNLSFSIQPISQECAEEKAFQIVWKLSPKPFDVCRRLEISLKTIEKGR